MQHIKTSLQTCANPLTPNTMSVSHRGTPLVYPEHTTEGYVHAMQLGANWIECDIAVTKDMQMVCRHSQCDLSSTTNILQIPTLAAKCTVPNKMCCTFDFTLAEYRQLCGVAYGASNPHLQLYSWNSSNPTACPARPAVLADMATMTIAAGRNLIPEQKNCDLLCQAKLAAANGVACASGSPYNNISCAAVLNTISDVIVRTIRTATGNDTSRSIVQTFETGRALYITSTYNAASGYDQPVTFLYEYHGQARCWRRSPRRATHRVAKIALARHLTGCFLSAEAAI